ncbi:hypothetical protein [Paraburkholderia sp. SIMBA_054]|uniref:hypothetical protein n=1 Tax=Paraburkholderia sp. SIMBA_054 TaxID=3085795 RepID=UPI0039788B77
MDDGSIVIGIPVVTGEAAPVALRATGRSLTTDKRWTVEYRWWKNQLWTSVNVDSNSEPRGRHSGKENWDWPAFPEQIDVRDGHRNRSQEYGYSEDRPSLPQADVVKGIKALSREHLVIDGKAYRTAREHCYKVLTFGLGRNHGGTGLFVDAASNARHARSEGFFNLFEREAAIRYGTEVAQERGDTDSLPMKVNCDVEWEILLPEAVRLPAREQNRAAPAVKR